MFTFRKAGLVAALGLCLCCGCSIAQTSSAQPLRALIEGLTSLSPKDRIIGASRYLDTLVQEGTPLPRVGQYIAHIQKMARKWNDNELEGYLAFYDKIKGAQLPIPSEEVLIIFNAALSYYEQQGDLRYAGVCHYFIGKHHFEQQQYGDAFYHHAKAQELFNKVGIEHILDIGKYLHVMALNYYYFRDYERVIQLMRASITLPPFSENLDMQRYNTLAMAYQRLDQLDSAAFYFRRTQEVARSWGDSTWICIAAGNLGLVYSKQGRYKEALSLHMQDYLYNRQREYDPVVCRNAAVTVASTLQKMGRRDSVMYYLRESERMDALVRKGNPMWKQQRDEEYNIAYYGVLHDYFKSKGNSAMAYHYLDSLTRLENEANLRYNKMTAKVAEDRLEAQEHLADIALEQADKKRISTRFQLMIGIIGLLAVILGLLYYLLRLRHAKERLEAEKERAIRLAAQEKTEAKLAKANLELQEYMLRLQEKNELVEAFQAQIQQLRSLSAHQAPQLDELTNRLAQTKLLTVDDWNDFRQRFNRAFSGELDQLKMRHRDLTSAEERIYALEKMNVSTGQMAWMLGISPESVRKAKYRLRKKIDITAA